MAPTRATWCSATGRSWWCKIPEGLDVEGNVTFTAGSGLSTSSPVLNNGTITQIGTAVAVSGYVTGTGIWDIAAFSIYRCSAM